MKKLIVDCTQDPGQQEAVQDITGAEAEALLEESARVASLPPPPPSLEERLAALEAALAALTGA